MDTRAWWLDEDGNTFWSRTHGWVRLLDKMSVMIKVYDIEGISRIDRYGWINICLRCFEHLLGA
jgi:hypothetical protein